MMLRKMSTFLVIFFVIKLCALSRLFEYLKSDKGRSLIKSGFRAAGIAKAVQNAREGIIVPLDPY